VMKAIWHIDSQKSELKEENLRKEFNIINSLYSNVSIGTEKLVATGRIPQSLHDILRVNYMAGNFSFPIKYGYSLVGECDKGIVHLMHPHQERVDAKNEDLYQIGKNLPPKRATLLSNMETVVNAIWDADLKGDENILVLGFGSVGALLALTLQYEYRYHVSLKEINKAKIILASELNITTSSDRDKYDVIFNTTGSYEALQYAIEHTEKDGKIIEMSWYGDKIGHLSLGADFHYNRIKLISSQVSTISPLASLNTTYLTRKQQAEKILSNAAFDNLITKEVRFEDSVSLFDDLRKGRLEDEVVVVIRYD
jgi:threonine dehydrogenase-like Zn-dependent dehydrogenase